MARATSVTARGEEDGWTPTAAWEGQVAQGGVTRVLVSVPEADLPAAHRALIAVLAQPLALLYRQRIDRRDPKPQDWPGRDFVAVELDQAAVFSALERHAPLVYGDARSEIWVRGNMGAQVVLDQDGVLYAYPDDPSFRDALTAAGIPEVEGAETMLERDYVKHWFHASNDAHEDALRSELSMTEVSQPR